MFCTCAEHHQILFPSIFRTKQKMKRFSIFYQNLWSNFNHLVWQLIEINTQLGKFILQTTPNIAAEQFEIDWIRKRY